MIVCCICNADGAMQVGQVWYCLNHLHDGLISTLSEINLLKGLNQSEDDIESVATSILESIGYEWPCDEEEEEDE